MTLIEIRMHLIRGHDFWTYRAGGGGGGGEGFAVFWSIQQRKLIGLSPAVAGLILFDLQRLHLHRFKAGYIVYLSLDSQTTL